MSARERAKVLRAPSSALPVVNLVLYSISSKLGTEVAARAFQRATTCAMRWHIAYVSIRQRMRTYAASSALTTPVPCVL